MKVPSKKKRLQQETDGTAHGDGEESRVRKTDAGHRINYFLLELSEASSL
jgi:hypothetical protein